MILALLVLPIFARAEELWSSKYGPQIDLPFTGPLSFAHLPYARCLDDPSLSFDIAILGLPFDTSVSYRPGARFGPHGIRAGSRRQRPLRGWTMYWKRNPYTDGGMEVLDCGDVPITPFDNALALQQMQDAYTTLLTRPRPSSSPPRIISLGGDHTIVLPILRSLHSFYNDTPISVIHFDSHLDSWAPFTYPGSTDSEVSQVNHGTFFWKASTEGLVDPTRSVHVGIRCKMGGEEDLVHEREMGFHLISTDDIDDIGLDGIIKMVREHVGVDSGRPVYLSFDIDAIDPAFVPATGTPEAGGFTTREVKRILRGLAGLNFVGMDLVEVSPAYDTNAETTGVVAADLVHQWCTSWTFGWFVKGVLSLVHPGVPPPRMTCVLVGTSVLCQVLDYLRQAMPAGNPFNRCPLSLEPLSESGGFGG